jgi:urease accessory protein
LATLKYLDGRSRITQAVANNPLKLFTRCRSGPVARLVASGYGGGFVAGDEIDLQLRVEQNAQGLLATQASTKVYKNPERLPCRQRISAHVESGAVFVAAPHPTICFADSLFDQRQHYTVALGGTLVVADWMLCGRWTSGERWEFSRYANTLHVSRGETPLIHEAVVLDEKDGPIAAPFRGGHFNCLGVAALVGERLKEPIAELLREIEQTSRQSPDSNRHSFVAVGAPVEDGALFRFAAESTEAAEQFLRRVFAAVEPLLGEPVWGQIL